jgi:hypothetical protein
MLKLGFGLYRHQLNADHYNFARQCGAARPVIHLADYFRSPRSNRPDDQLVGDDAGSLTNRGLSFCSAILILRWALAVGGEPAFASGWVL